MVYCYWGGRCHEVGGRKGQEVGKNPHFQSFVPFAWLEATATHECAEKTGVVILNTYFIEGKILQQ